MQNSVEKQRNPIHRAFALAAVIVTALVYFLPWMLEGAQDRRLSYVKNYDELVYVQFVNQQLQDPGFECEHYDYGHLYFNLAAVLTKIGSLSGSYTDRTIILALRGISLVSAILLLVFLFEMGYALQGCVTGLMAALFAFISNPFLGYATFAHPDMLQAALLTGALWCCVKALGANRPIYIWVGAVFAGLAFSAKLSGLFFLPVLAVGYLIVAARNQNEKTGIAFWVESLMRFALWAPLLTLGAFAATSPYCLIHFDKFREAIRLQSWHVGKGHYFQDLSNNAFSWMQVLFSDKGLSVILIVAALAAMVVLILRRNNNLDEQSANRAAAAVLSLGWVLLFLGLLMVKIRFRAPHYLLPILPALALMAGAAPQALASWFRQPQRLRRVRGLLAVLILALLLPNLIHAGFKQVSESTWTQRDAAVQLGNWIAERYPADTVIVTDPYTYVPEKFAKVVFAFGIRYGLIKSADPDLILLNEDFAKRFEDPNKAGQYTVGSEEDYLRIHYTYKRLFANRLVPYRLVKKAGRVYLYEKTKPPVP